MKRMKPKRNSISFYVWLIGHYKAPKGNCSVLYWVPIELLEATKFALKAARPQERFRIIYRGPRYDWMRAFTRKADAVAFSVYYK